VSRFLLLLIFIASALFAFLSGSGEIQRLRSKAAPTFNPLVDKISPEREHPLVEQKAFAFVLYAHNAAAWCERSLRSIFEQEYDYFRVLFIDDGSIDGTFEKAQQFLVDNHLEERVVALRNETPVGKLACLYRAAQACLDKEILIPLDACNWLSFEGALSRLNRVFQNPDIWIACGASLEYPKYQIRQGPHFESAQIQKKGFSLSEEMPFLAFYAGLFKAIRLPDLLCKGMFATGALSWQLPLLELAGGRCRSLIEPLVFENLAISRRIFEQEAQLPERSPYRPLAQWPLSTLRQEGCVELVLFSFDRPLQLCATLESIQRYLSGSFSCTLLYRASDARFEAAYQELLALFPEVRFVKQSDRPRKDFKPLLEKILSETPAEYVLFCTDDVVLTDFVNLDVCRILLEQTDAYGFYFRFGLNIQRSYLANQPLALPQSVFVGNGVFAWDLRHAEGEWEGANNFEMSLYRKKDLQPQFEQFSYKNPQTLLEVWGSCLPEQPIGLYFEHSKLVNLPLNAVQASGKPTMNYMTVEELLLKFNQGLKIDLEPLFQVNNPAPHYEWAPELVQR